MEKKTNSFDNRINVRIDEELSKLLDSVIALEGLEKSEAIRYCLRLGAEQLLMNETKDSFLYLVSKSIRETLKPFEERIAAISAKSAIASNTALYSNLEIYQLFGKDAGQLFDAAYKKAVMEVKRKEE